MTEYELEDLLTSTSLAAVESFGMYVSITTAFLIASYLAGGKLTNPQAAVVSILYVVASAVSGWATIGYCSRAIPVADALELMHPERFYGMQPLVLVTMSVLQTLGIIASLKFMWDTRHTETG